MSLELVNQSSGVNNSFDPLLGTQEIPVPSEIAQHILTFLPLEEVGRSNFVSSGWHQLASSDDLWKTMDLKTYFPMLRQIDQKAWEEYVDLEQHGLSFEGLKPIPNKTLILEVHKFSALSIKDNASFTLMHLPNRLSFNRLVEIAQDPKEGNTTGFRSIWDEFQNQLGGDELAQSCVILITNNILEESRQKSLAEQQELVASHQCEMPSVLEVSALAIFTRIMTGERLYPQEPDVTFTRCSDQASGSSVIVGGFGADGLTVGDDYFSDDDFLATAAVRKF